MRVLYIDGVAIYSMALSRASAAREGGGEASVGVVQAEVIEPRNGTRIRGADARVIGGRPCRQQRYREPLGDPARSESLGMYEVLHEARQLRVRSHRLRLREHQDRSLRECSRMHPEGGTSGAL